MSCRTVRKTHRHVQVCHLLPTDQIIQNFLSFPLRSLILWPLLGRSGVTKPKRSTGSPLLPPARLLYLDFISCLCPEVSSQTNRRPLQLQCTRQVGRKSKSCESNKLPDFETKRQRWIGCLQPGVQTATCRSVERLEWSSENKRLLNTAPPTHTLHNMPKQKRRARPSM